MAQAENDPMTHPPGREAEGTEGQSLPPEQLDAHARRYRGALLSYFSRRLQNVSYAEDLTQEVFVRLARHRQVDNITHMEAYLFQTASNLLRDHARREVTQRQGDHLSLDEAGYEGEAPSEENVYEGREALEAFIATLVEMPPRRREVFLMHRFMGMSYSAIATQLGISVGGVEKHMTKALLQFHSSIGTL